MQKNQLFIAATILNLEFLNFVSKCRIQWPVEWLGQKSHKYIGFRSNRYLAFIGEQLL